VKYLRWSDWVSYIDGALPKFAFLIPFIGYAVLFNDEVTSKIAFKEMADKTLLDTGVRLRLIYFGLCFIGFSNLIYRIRKPYVFKLANNIRDFMNVCFDIFTYSDFLQLHRRIEMEGHKTLYGKYRTALWELFSADVPSDNRDAMAIREKNWEDAIKKHGDVLRSILAESFNKEDLEKRNSLIVCIILSTIGYFCLLVSGMELFLSVIVSTLHSNFLAV